MGVLRDTKLIAQAGLARARSAVLGPWVTAVLCDSPVNGRLLVPAGDLAVGRRLAFQGAYDAERIELMLRLVGPRDRVLVLGAHVGALVVPLARAVSHVTAFEANPDTFELLSQNLVLNGLTNVDAHNLAAVDRAGTERFLLSRVNTGGSKVAPTNDRFMYRYDRPREVEVEAVALDAFLEGLRYDLVLMDIEGSEPRAARGMPAILADARLLLVEFVPHHLRDVAGVDVEGWVEAFGRSFPHALVLESDAPAGENGWVGRKGLIQRLRVLGERDASADVLLSAEPPPDAASG